MNKPIYFLIFVVLMNIGCVIRLSISGNNKKTIIIFLIIANTIFLIAFLDRLPDLSLHSWLEFFRTFYT